MLVIVLSHFFCNLFLPQSLKGNYVCPHFTVEEFPLTKMKKHFQGHVFYMGENPALN